MPILVKFDAPGLMARTAANAGEFGADNILRNQQQEDARIDLDYWNSQQRADIASRGQDIDLARMENDNAYRNALLEQRATLQDDRQDFTQARDMYKDRAKEEYLGLIDKAKRGQLDQAGQQRLQQIEATAKKALEREKYKQGQQNDRFYSDQESDWARLYEGERIGDERQDKSLKAAESRAALQRANQQLLQSQRLSAQARASAGKDPQRAARVKAQEDARDQAWKMYSDTVHQMEKFEDRNMGGNVLPRNQQAHDMLRQRSEQLMAAIEQANARLQSEILSTQPDANMPAGEWDKLYGEDAFGPGVLRGRESPQREDPQAAVQRVTAEVKAQMPGASREQLRQAIKQRLMQDGVDPASLGIR